MRSSEKARSALKLLVATKKRESLLGFEGKIRFAEGYDYKKLREESA